MYMGGPSGITVGNCLSAQTIEDRPHLPTQLRNFTPNAPGWQALPLAARIGLDLVYVKQAAPGLSDVFPDYPERNQVLDMLPRICDPESEEFGNSTDTTKGPVLVKSRDDQRMLHPAILGALERFVEERLTAIKAALADKGLQAAREEFEKICPKKFKIFFKEYRVKQGIKWGRKRGWHTLECPVVLDEPACEACGLEVEAENKVSLMQCSRYVRPVKVAFRLICRDADLTPVMQVQEGRLL